MSQRYVLRLQGEAGERKMIEVPDVDAARNEAVRFLGGYLVDHPTFAGEGHWRVNVEDDHGQALLHVIVATVTARNARNTNCAPSAGG